MPILTLAPLTRKPVESTLASITVDALDTGLAETLTRLHITLQMIAAIGVARALDTPNTGVHIPKSDGALAALSTCDVGPAETLATVPIALMVYRSSHVTIAA